MIFHFIALFFIAKIIRAFGYLLFNNKDLANDLRRSFFNNDTAEKDSIRHREKIVIKALSEYYKHNTILLFFSIGIPYWVIYIIIRMIINES